MNVIRILEREILTKTCELRKKGEGWRITTDKVMKDILHWADFIRPIKSLIPRWYGHVERMQNQKRPKQTATATMEGTIKSGRPRKG
jgi:hypothetical protein